MKRIDSLMLGGSHLSSGCDFWRPRALLARAVGRWAVKTKKQCEAKYGRKSNAVSGVRGRKREYEVILNAQISRACDSWLLARGILSKPLVGGGQ
jgi:hypothetical protein